LNAACERAGAPGAPPPRFPARLAALIAIVLAAAITGCARPPQELLDATVDGGSEVRWVHGDSLLAVALLGRGVALIDAVNGEQRSAWRTPTLPSHPARGLAASASGETLAVATEDSVRVFLVPDCTPVMAATGGGVALALSADGRRLAWSDGTVGRTLDAASGRVIRESQMFVGRNGIAWSARTGTFAWTDTRMVVFEGSDSTSAGELGPFMDACPAQLAFSESGHTLAVAESTLFVSFWDTVSRRARWRLKLAGRARFERMTLSADNAYLGTSFEGRARVVWAYTGRALAEWKPHRGAAVRDLAFSRDGLRLATVGADGHVRVWAMPARRQERH
jgi:WD40 repeat protein